MGAHSRHHSRHHRKPEVNEDAIADAHVPGEVNPVNKGFNVSAELTSLKGDFSHIKWRVNLTGALFLAGYRGAVMGERMTISSVFKDTLAATVTDIIQQVLTPKLLNEARKLHLDEAELRALLSWVITATLDSLLRMEAPTVSRVLGYAGPAIASELLTDPRVKHLLEKARIV